ncbi:brain-specific angiogenesis inhibitor 1-associated protein 2-like protein 2 isoform X1 [Cyprinodon tularosa]|uniref:brain-specific angiogenesis inhibitor 1-associated protein 2-like protein 2 isoform X1 n=1 Tax=Cyprinodon tularosa TaxID=77115 RepID=UPI0018E28B27|nr:brain-specific angiogenesis inhibitor 1-associated protein 2-like protein 2 isoform X1 [Cyprinodon tularosa]
MSGINSDQLHRSTLGIYMSLTDELNPSLQKLVSLGNSYAHAFKALAVSSEAYFNALSKIGEKAFYSMSSRSLGDVLIQISENQRRLTLELEGVFRKFSLEVLQVMDNNIHLDRDYISDSRVKYEKEVHNQTAGLHRQRSRGKGQDSGEYAMFLRESHREALEEEERRYRFVAEKHCDFIQSIGRLMNKTGGTLLQRADIWSEEIGATRRPEARRPEARRPEARRPEARQPEPRQHAAVENTGGMRSEDIRQIREEMTLGRVPSRAPSPVGSVYRSRGGGEGVSMRAKVAHQPAGNNPTLLPFSRGQIITVMVQQPRNGWIYGNTENGSNQGWFPASYVEELDDPPMSPNLRNSNLHTNMSNLVRPRASSTNNGMFDQPKPSNKNFSTNSSIGSTGGAQPPPPPPPMQTSSKSESHRPQSELFPRGTNPFATVKLKPTKTNDRSAPIIHRR